MPSIRALRPAAVVALCASAVPAQQPFAAQIAALADPLRQETVTALLLDAGATAVPALRRCLGDAGAPVGQLSAALFVAGRLGGLAFTALPEVQHLYRMHGDPGVRRQALWAIGCIGSAVRDRERARELRRFAIDHRATDVDGFLLEVVCRRLQLAAQGHVLGERDFGDDGPAGAIAVAEGVGNGMLALTPRLQEWLLQRLDAVTDRSCWPWDDPWRLGAATGELAVVGWTRLGRQTPATAIGLLRHWDPAWRILALQELATKQQWLERERLDVVACLRDGHRGVRDQALAIVRGWGGDGLPALWTLRNRGVDAAQTAEGDAVASAMLRAAIAADPAGEPALRAIDRAITGGTPAAASVGAGQARYLAQVLRGCAPASPAAVQSLWDLAGPGAATPDVIDALLLLLAGEHRRVVLHILTTLGPAVFTARPDADVLMLRALAGQVGLDTVFALQAEILAGPGANEAELRQAAADAGRWHVAVRAWLELVRRGLPVDADLLAHIRSRAAATWPPVEISQGEDWARRRGSGFSVAGLPPPGEHPGEAAGIVAAAAGETVRAGHVQAAVAAIARLRTTLGMPPDGW